MNNGQRCSRLELSADNNLLNSVILTEIERTITIKCMLIVLATEIKRFGYRFGYVKYVAKEHAASSKAILKCHQHVLCGKSENGQNTLFLPIISSDSLASYWRHCKCTQHTLYSYSVYPWVSLCIPE